ncbi:phosphoribosylglycinamide formyltransferase [candidate division KSB1 bacterium]|nr:phosphoribosylglycinamide formyltransferase [candidate division KSB1 bacterium]
MQLHLAVFVSGRGSNFLAILDAIANGKLSAKIAVLISDRSEAGALHIAQQAGVATEVLACREEEKYEHTLRLVLQHRAVNFIVLAGYLRKIPAAIIRAYRGRIINIHPALLPSFGGKGMYGLRVHQAVLDYGCKVSGATVHFVEEEYDTGAPIMQRCVPVRDNDTAETLAARVLQVEHQVLPEALQLFAEERVQVEERRVRIL